MFISHKEYCSRYMYYTLREFLGLTIMLGLIVVSEAYGWMEPLARHFGLTY